VSKAVKAIGIGLAIVFTGGLAAGALALGGFGLAAVTTVWNIGLALGVSTALSGISLALAKTPRMPRVVQDVEYTDTVASRRIIYGRMRASGLNAIPPLVTGPNGENLHQILVLAGHPVNAIGDVYFDYYINESGWINPITGTASDGLVTDGFYEDVAWIRRYPGDPNQTADYILRTAHPDWTADHRGRNLAYIALTYKLDEKKYARGKPEVTALVEGKRVYDPRLDTSPGANPTNASYIAYSNNPALCLADYLIDADLGMGEEATRIDWSLVVATANICDEWVQILGNMTQRRYTCNVVLDATSRFEDNITLLSSAMMGHCYYSGGKWLMYAGAWHAPSFTLTQNDVVGDFEIVTAYPYQERYNAVRGRYLDEARQWQEVEFNPRINSAYVAEDGETIWREAFFPACTNEYEAQRNAIIALRMSRNKKVLSASFGLSAFGIRPFETGTMTIPELDWNAQPVTCESWSFSPNGTVSLSLREARASVWNDPAPADYGESDSIGQPISESFKPYPVTAASAIGTFGGITVSWSANSTNPPATRYCVYRHTASTPFSSATKVATVLGSEYFDTRFNTNTFYYWLTAEDPSTGVESDPVPNGAGIPAAALTGSAGSEYAVSVNPSSHYFVIPGSKLGYGIGSSTAEVSGGTAPYTYSWTKVSGASQITMTGAGTGPTEGFQTLNISAGTLISALFRVTVTDDESPQNSASADVTVVVERL
jgi:hypothetical protein